MKMCKCYRCGRSLCPGACRVSQVHGNKGKKPYRALLFQDIKRFEKFVINFAEENGISLPAAPRCRDDIPPIFIHLSHSKKTIHNLYVNSCE